ncbi:hypothetical protein [Kitasatospora sp. NPDC017646]|uniref:hypothetical protein n=1 Tax=Kitasatospora sp. NPDC017646 TaxID=3364024 RepID=UPI0037B08736
MGGSGWAETGPYQEDLGAAFRQAQARELAKDDHGFPGQSISELWRDETKALKTGDRSADRDEDDGQAADVEPAWW